MVRPGLRWTVARAMALLLMSSVSTMGHAQESATIIFRNGTVFTADAKDSVQQAVVVRNGRILYVGTNVEADRFAGADVRVIDLNGRMLMPGLVDGHLHPIGGGAMLRSCNLEYQPLTEAEFLGRIQTCLDQDQNAGPDGFLRVVGWYRQYMLPQGTDATRDTLDKLRTRRPIIVVNRDGHSQLVNSRALGMAGIDDRTPNPPGGSITRDSKGRATGILEDGAAALVARLLPPPSADESQRNAEAAMQALSAAGVTSMLDAMASEDSLKTYNALQKSGKLTVRTHVAVMTDAAEVKEAGPLVAEIVRLRDRYDQREVGLVPGVRVHTAKLVMDGVIQAPAQTAGLVAPYWVPMHTNGREVWQPGTRRGPIYIRQDILDQTVAGLAGNGIDPHIHAIGDNAVKLSLDAIAKARAGTSREFRPAIAHAELVEPVDYARFRQLDVAAVMSYQWSIPGPNSVIGAKNPLGPARFERMEPFDKLYGNGARVVYGSDWPVDRLNYWLALKGGITRAGDQDIPQQFKGRLNDAPGLSRRAALRSITIEGAWALHQEKETGSIEVGKLADLIVLDRNFLTVPEATLAENKVLLTMVGGKIVHDDGSVTGAR